MRAHTVIIIGSGFGGQSAAIKLRQMGIDDFLILERRSFMGGTWLQNTYPGAAVDVQSPLYSLAGERYDWTQLFAEQAELAAYTEHIIETHRLRARTALDADVVGIRWDEAGAAWDVEVADGRRFRGRFVINASGPLSTPRIPAFEGAERFAGAAFHTNDWRHDVGLAGRRVAVIGSGASAAQVIPAIAPVVEHLDVFMRTPHWVLPRWDRVFSRTERALMRNRWIHDLVRWAIYWGLEHRVVGFKYSRRLLDLVGRGRALRQLKRQVPDPALREKLTPHYVIGCKRILLSNTLLPALGRDNVTLRSREQGVARITEAGIETATGERVDLDVIVYATGFRATDGAVPYRIEGRDGVTLDTLWAGFPRAYLGTTVPGLPNFFLITGPNTGIGHTSALFIIESQLFYIADCINAVRSAGAIEVRQDAEARYTTMIHEEMQRTVWQSGGCDSWYKSESGHVIAMFPGFSFSFRRMTKRFVPEDHDTSP